MESWAIKLILGLFGAISTIINIYLSYRLQKGQNETKQEIAKTDKRTKMKKQTQDMFKFWVREFNSIKDEWKEERGRMRDKVSRFNDRVETLENQVHNLKDTLHKRDKKIAKFEKMLSEKNKEIEELQSKLNKREDMIDELSVKLEYRDEVIDDLEKRVDNISDTVNGEHYEN